MPQGYWDEGSGYQVAEAPPIQGVPCFRDGQIVTDRQLNALGDAIRRLQGLGVRAEPIEPRSVFAPLLDWIARKR